MSEYCSSNLDTNYAKGYIQILVIFSPVSRPYQNQIKTSDSPSSSCLLPTGVLKRVPMQTYHMKMSLICITVSLGLGNRQITQL